MLATYGYDDLGRRVSLTRGNGRVTTWTPDGMSRLTSLTDNLQGTSRDQTVTYGYNGVSQLRTRQTTNDAYSYGGYDPSSVAATPNALNQLASVGGTALTYNPNGNLTADNRDNAYTYNLDNQLTAKAGTGSLAYDPLGRLSALLPGAATIRFDYDGTDLIAESDAGGALTKRYVHGPGVDEPLVWYDGAGTTQRHWLSADERGSITAIADDTGRATRVNTYDENGVPDPRNVGRFGYTGQTWLAEVGLSYYKARMYDPVSGRFMQSDPIGYGGGMNLYAYVGGDPINYSDTSGTRPRYVCGGIDGQPLNCGWSDDGAESSDGWGLPFSYYNIYGGGSGSSALCPSGTVRLGSECVYDTTVWARNHGYIKDEPQKSLLDKAKYLYCSLPSIGLSTSARGYDILGGGFAFDFAFDPQSGRFGFSGGIDVGVGYGGEVRWSAGNSATFGRNVANGWSGSVGANANVRLGPIAAGASTTLIGRNGPGFGGMSAGIRPGGTGATINGNLGVRGGYGGQVAPSCGGK